MAKRTRHDDLHDRYHTIATTKSGNRYERLAALVFKALEENNTIIHDMKLIGSEPDIKHQIDVIVEDPNRGRRRILIECKDFDISGDNVGLGIVRDFRSVVEDTEADEGIILTCNGFTTMARKYAKSKNIKLCVLRIVESSDMKARIRKIVMRFVVEHTLIDNAIIAISAEDNDIYQSNLRDAGVSKEGVGPFDPVYFVNDSQKEQFCSFLYHRVHQAELWKTTPKGSLAMPANNWKLQVEDNPPIVFQGTILDVRKERDEETLNITSDRVAELILSGYDDHDLVIFGDELERFTIDEESGLVERT